MGRFFEDLNNRIWAPLPDGAAFLFRLPIQAMRLLMAVARDVREGNLSLRATSLVYTTLLSLAPVLAVSFSVLKGFGVHGQIEPFLKDFLQPLGDKAEEVSTRIIAFVDNINVGVLGIVGVAFLFYGVVSLMHKIETAFNDIWRVPTSRSVAFRVRDYLSVLLIGPLFMFLSVGMTASVRHAAFLQEWIGVDLLNSAVGAIFIILPYGLFTLVFAMLYMFMPNTQVRFMPAFVAGLVTAVLWKALGWLFGTFVVGSGSYAAIYSAFATLILFMIWIYAGWLLVLTGASLCYYLQNPSNQALSRKFRQLGYRFREKVALQIVAEIGRAFYAHDSGLSARDLARKLDVPEAVVDEVADELSAASIITCAADRKKALLPATPFDTTSVCDMLLALRRVDDAGILTADKIRATANVDKVLRVSDAALRDVLGGISLKQMATGETEK